MMAYSTCAFGELLRRPRQRRDNHPRETTTPNLPTYSLRCAETHLIAYIRQHRQHLTNVLLRPTLIKQRIEGTKGNCTIYPFKVKGTPSILRLPRRNDVCMYVTCNGEIRDSTLAKIKPQQSLKKVALLPRLCGEGALPPREIIGHGSTTPTRRDIRHKLKTNRTSKTKSKMIACQPLASPHTLESND